MKKLFIFLFAIMAIMVSCEKDYLVDVPTQVGAQGIQGETYLSLWQFDAVANTDKCWLDYNQDGKFTPDIKGVKSGKGDSLMVVHTLSGIDYIPSENPGCFKLVITKGNTKITKEICNGSNGLNGNDGHNGNNGKDAHEFILGSRPQPNGDQFLDFYWDTKGPSFGMLTADDTIKYTVVIPKGLKGDKGDVPMFQANMEQVGNTIVYTLVTSEGTSTASVKIPESIVGPMGPRGFNTLYSVKPFIDMKGDTTMNIFSGVWDVDYSGTINTGDSLQFNMYIKNGKQGDRGFTEVEKVTPIVMDGVVVGNHFDKYLDIDGIPGYSSGDKNLYYGYDTMNGLIGATGPQGPAGESSIVNWSIGLTSTTTCGNVEIIFSVTINGETKTASIEIPKTDVDHGHIRCEKKDHKCRWYWHNDDHGNDCSRDRFLGECDSN